MKQRRIGVREGYDRWAETYDQTPNPLVALDRRHTINLLAPRSGERILDAGCGTGANLARILRAESRPVGVDFSFGMLRVACRNVPHVPLVQADLEREMPVRPLTLDAVLCALVGEHLASPGMLFREAFKALRPGGRLLFSVFHPEMAAAGIEANFERDGVEYRLGALRHTVDDYLNLIDSQDFRAIRKREFSIDEELVGEIPSARKYLGRNLLLVIEAMRLD